MTLAQPEDVQARLGRPITDSEQPTVAALLADVEALIRVQVPDLADRAATDQQYFQLLVMVESNAVVRVLRNPEGLRTVTVAVDDGSVTKTRDQGSAGGGLYVTDAEWDLLLPCDDAPAAFSSPVRYVPGWAHAPATRWGRP